MSLVTVAEARAEVETTLSDSELQVVIDRIEAEITDSLGASHAALGAGDLTETHAGYCQSLFLNRKITSVTTVTEYDSLVGATGRVLTEGEDFVVWPKEGRLQRVGRWGAKVVVAYEPLDQDKKWESAIVDLLKLALVRSPLMSETVANEMAYTRPDNWEQEKLRIIRRLRFVTV